MAESPETEGVADCEPGWLDAKATNAQRRSMESRRKLENSKTEGFYCGSGSDLVETELNCEQK